MEKSEMKAPKEGSRKAEVYAIYHDKGLAAATKHAESVGLKAGTVKSWASAWGKAPGDTTTEPTERKAKVKREAVTQDYSPHFKHVSHAAAVKHIQAICRRNGMSSAAFHVLEEKGKFAVAPAHYNPKGPAPTFTKGQTVFDTTISDSRGTVIEAGPEQCVVDFPDKEPRERTVPNRYLCVIEGEAPPAKAPKKPKPVKAPAPAKPPAKAPAKPEPATPAQKKSAAKRKAKK